MGIRTLSQRFNSIWGMFGETSLIAKCACGILQMKACTRVRREWGEWELRTLKNARMRRWGDELSSWWRFLICKLWNNGVNVVKLVIQLCAFQGGLAWLKCEVRSRGKREAKGRRGKKRKGEGEKGRREEGEKKGERREEEMKSTPACWAKGTSLRAQGLCVTRNADDCATINGLWLLCTIDWCESIGAIASRNNHAISPPSTLILFAGAKNEK